jgi:hypothetical protein
VNVSAPSVLASAEGVTVNEATPPVTVNDPLTAEKSSAAEVTWLIVQYPVEPLAKLEVTLNVPSLPSLILDGIEVNPKTGVKLVSLTTIKLAVFINGVPFTDPDNKLIPKVLDPSVVASAVMVTFINAWLFVTVIDPVLPPVMSELVVLPVVFQYNTVPSDVLVVVTVYCIVFDSLTAIFNP